MCEANSVVVVGLVAGHLPDTEHILYFSFASTFWEIHLEKSKVRRLTPQFFRSLPIKYKVRGSTG